MNRISHTRKTVLVLLAVCIWSVAETYGQKFGIKSNALYWATSTPNLGLEIGLGKRTTLELSGGYNPWTLNREANRKLKHWLVMPEFRYWICERFQGHFFGLHSGYAFYNFSNVRLPFRGPSSRNYRYQGRATGAGLSYGYAWILGKRWNLEATLGLGYVYTNYDRYDCATCGRFRGDRNKHYFGPTKAGLSVIYMIK